jgi:hypothetical protein
VRCGIWWFSGALAGAAQGGWEAGAGGGPAGSFSPAVADQGSRRWARKLAARNLWALGRSLPRLNELPLAREETLAVIEEAAVVGEVLAVGLLFERTHGSGGESCGGRCGARPWIGRERVRGEMK